jgi:hypothetical protein
LCDDIEYNIQKTLNCPDYQMAEDKLKNHLLDKLTLLFTKSGGNIQDFNLPTQSRGVQVLGVNHLTEEELRHDIDTLIQ